MAQAFAVAAAADRPAGCSACCAAACPLSAGVLLCTGRGLLLRNSGAVLRWAGFLPGGPAQQSCLWARVGRGALLLRDGRAGKSAARQPALSRNSVHFYGTEGFWAKLRQAPRWCRARVSLLLGAGLLDLADDAAHATRQMRDCLCSCSLTAYPPLPVQAPAGMPWTACAEQRLLRACPAAHCSEVFSGLLQVPHCTAVMPCPVGAETLHACPATACTGCLMAGPAQLTGRSSFLEWALMARPALHGGLSGVLNWCRCITARR